MEAQDFLISTKETTDNIALDLIDIRDGLAGSWKIENNQMVMCREAGGTVFKTFNLLNKAVVI